jgi:hypothetical protein
MEQVTKKYKDTYKRVLKLENDLSAALGELGPERYPCVAVWGIRYNGDGPDELYGEFVYLDDFETE